MPLPDDGQERFLPLEDDVAPGFDDEALVGEPDFPGQLSVREADGGVVAGATVELMDELEGFDFEEAMRCDFHDHKAELIATLRTMTADEAAFSRWTTDATGSFEVPSWRAFGAGRWVRVTRPDGTRAIEPVPLSDTIVLSAPLEGSTRLLGSDGGVIASAEILEFEPGTNTLFHSRSDAEGRWHWQSRVGGLYFIEAQGFLNFTEHSRSPEIHLSRPGTLEVHAPWAPNGTVVRLSRAHDRQAVLVGGWAKFERVKAEAVVVSVSSPQAQVSATVTVEEGQTTVLELPLRRASTAVFVVRGPHGEPIPGFEVEVTGERGTNYHRITANEQGDPLEDPGLAEGPIGYRVVTRGFEVMSVETTLAPGRNVFTHRLQATVSVTGVVRSRNGLLVWPVAVLASERVGDLSQDGNFSFEVLPTAALELKVLRGERVVMTTTVSAPASGPISITLPFDAVALEWADGSPGDPSVVLHPRGRRAAPATCFPTEGRCPLLLDVEVEDGTTYDLSSDEGGRFEPSAVTISRAQPLIPVKFDVPLPRFLREPRPGRR
ncbi:MAG: hypothetical protein SFW67_09980 [Myxococcaceae bacterium]|nr:hypothetical protein [Myxococcaceae bacterium]